MGSIDGLEIMCSRRFIRDAGTDGRVKRQMTDCGGTLAEVTSAAGGLLGYMCRRCSKHYTPADVGVRRDQGSRRR